MTSTLILIAATVIMVMQNVFMKQYNKRTGNLGGIIFCSVSALVAAIVFIAAADYPMSFEPGVAVYSLGFALSYSTNMIFTVIAISCGSLALTSLMVSYSLIIPTAYGIIFLHNPVSATLVAGFILFAVSLFLINYSGAGGEGGSKITLKWLICAGLAFLGNGMCSTVQNMQVTEYSGEMKSEFMIAAYIVSMVGMLIYSLFSERKDIVPSLKKGWLQAALCGLFNGLLNFLVISLIEIGDIPEAVLYPTISAGGMILAVVISVFVYREKMSKYQFIGFFMGIFSVILLNL